MAQPIKATIYITRNDTTSWTFTFTQGATSTPKDITGATLFFTVKDWTDTTSSDATALITKTVTSHTNASGGLTALTLATTDTTIAAGSYKYDFQLKESGGTTTTFLYGECVVLDDVTKRTS